MTYNLSYSRAPRKRVYNARQPSAVGATGYAQLSLTPVEGVLMCAKARYVSSYISSDSLHHTAEKTPRGDGAEHRLLRLFLEGQRLPKPLWRLVGRRRVPQ
ncbi:hypothetical protein PC128_g23880 [Phytophthora cactorum]|nr:hypothetical protein PC128_g23880 [Phytophthora cactorum]